MVDNNGGLIAQQQAKIAAIEAEVAALEARVSEAFGNHARLQAEVDRNPAPGLIAELANTVEAARRLRAQLPVPGRYQTNDLGIRLERARQELTQLREQRQVIARRIHEIEGLHERYGDVVDELFASAQFIRDQLGLKGWPRHIDSQEVSKVWSWSGGLRNDFASLDNLRARLESFGDDPDGPSLPDYELEGKQRLWEMAGLMTEPARG